MTTSRTVALLIVLFGGPYHCFFIIDLMRDAGSYITLYLISAYVLAALIPTLLLAKVLFRPSEISQPTIWRTILGTIAALFAFFLIAGIAQVTAESIAAWNWKRTELPLGDHGSYREFYPGDSGMAHWPTPWHVIPTYGLLAALVWGPIVLIVLLGVHAIENRAGRVIRRISPAGARVDERE